MALDIDGFEVLRLIGGRPKLFPSVAIEAKTVARKLATKQITETDTIDNLNAICKYLGKETFVLLLDGPSPTALRKVIKRIDPHRPESKKATAPWLRNHLAALATGELMPSPKLEPPKKTKSQRSESTRKTTPKRRKEVAPKDKQTPAGEPSGFFRGTAMGATRKR
jgi:hypothetical protein